jgi:hypothetical protein
MSIVNAPTQVNRQTVKLGDTKFWLGALLALSVVINVFTCYELRDHGTLKWLHDWDLNQFENGPFTQAKIELGSLDARVRALENAQVCKPK